MIEESHGVTGHGTVAAPAFSDNEVRSLRGEDVVAGKAIVLLMAGIFIVGLVLYLFVAWWVS